MDVHYCSKMEEMNTLKVLVITEFVKTIWTVTLKSLQVITSSLCLLYGLVTLNTRPNIQIERSEDNEIYIDITTDKRLRMTIVLHLPEYMMLMYVRTKSGYRFNFKAMVTNQTINGTTPESLNVTNCAPTRPLGMPSFHQQLNQANDAIRNENNETMVGNITTSENQSNTEHLLRMNEDRETRRKIQEDKPDDHATLNKKLELSKIISKEAQCVSKINQDKCKESLTEMDYDNKSQENAVDINLKDISLPGVDRKKMRNRSRTKTMHKRRQTTTKRVYPMVQFDVVGYMVLDYFSQKQWHERPHVLWPSMHPLLLSKVIYLPT